jgi:hypothetical protein
MMMELPPGTYQTGDRTLPDDISHIKVPDLLSAVITDKNGKSKTLTGRDEYDFCTDGYWSNDRIVKIVITQIEIPTQPIPIPKMDVEMYFSVEKKDSVETTCSAIEELARTSGSVENFLNNYKINTNQLYSNLANFYSDLINPLIDQTQAISTLPGYDLIDAYLKTIEISQLPVLRHVYSCINEAIAIDPETLKKAETGYETAKARYESISPDHERVSYYEGWLPLFRPVKETSLFVLFGFSVVFLTISILFFLQLGGFQIQFILPENQSGPLFNFGSFNSYVYAGVGCGLLFTGVGRYYKWF